MNSKKKKRNRLIEGICFVSKDKKNKVTKKKESKCSTKAANVKRVKCIKWDKTNLHKIKAKNLKMQKPKINHKTKKNGNRRMNTFCVILRKDPF